MRIGRWSEICVDSVCQEQEVMRDVNANETSGVRWNFRGGVPLKNTMVRPID